MKKIGIKIFAMWLAVGVCIGTGELSLEPKDMITNSVHADASRSIDDIYGDIYDASNDRLKMEKQKSRIQKEIKDLEATKEELIAYINKSDRLLNKLQRRINATNRKARRLRNELDMMEADAEQMELDKQEKYETMRKRIQYVYENTNESYLSVVLSSENLSDFLNNVEYVEKITEFDKQIIDEYEQKVALLESQSVQIDEKYADIVYVQQCLKEDRADVRAIIEKKKKKLEAYNDKIDDAEENISDVEAKIAQAEEEIESLLEQQRAQMASQNVSGTAVSYSVNDVTGFAWPLPRKASISSYFGPRVAPAPGASSFHKGVDLSVPSGTNILASKGGKVVISMYSSSAGYYIGIYHGNNTYSYYMHCSALFVEAGDKVRQGQIIAKSGSTGISTGPHLHFAINVDGNYVDPLLYIAQP